MPSLQQRRHQSDSDDEYGDFAAAAVPPTKRKPKTTTTQHQRSRTEDAAAAAPCFLCGDGRQRLMLSLGEAVFLSLPARGSLCEGHCVLATVQHTPSFREADAAAQKELKRFKAALVEMFRMQRRGVVFIERRARRPTHAAVEAVPLPLELSEEAPAYFKQALLQADEEWAQHKKIIDTAAERGGIATAVPCEFPYFHVEFDDGHGFAHVIEDDAKVPWHFGRSVLAGMLELPPTVYLKPRAHASVEEERRDVKRFLDEWAAFDWTSELEGGEYL